LQSLWDGCDEYFEQFFDLYCEAVKNRINPAGEVMNALRITAVDITRS